MDVIYKLYKFLSYLKKIGGDVKLKVDIEDLTEEEMLLILEFREKRRNKDEKNFFRKYFFNKYALFDFKQSIIRETIRAIFLLYIIEKLKSL